MYPAGGNDPQGRGRAALAAKALRSYISYKKPSIQGGFGWVLKLCKKNKNISTHLFPVT
jgi:hypothetical protein